MAYVPWLVWVKQAARRKSCNRRNRLPNPHQPRHHHRQVWHYCHHHYHHRYIVMIIITIITIIIIIIITTITSSPPLPLSGPSSNSIFPGQRVSDNNVEPLPEIQLGSINTSIVNWITAALSVVTNPPSSTLFHQNLS